MKADIQQEQQQQQQQQEKQQALAKTRSRRNLLESCKSQRSLFTSRRSLMSRSSSQDLGQSWHLTSQESLDVSLDEEILEPRKSQARRCSIGQVFLCQFPKRSNHHTTTSREDTCYSASTFDTTELVVDEAESLLREVEQSLEQQRLRQASLQNNLNSDQRLAKARHMAGNDMGAVLSMRKVHKNIAILETVQAAMVKLTALQREIEEAVQAMTKTTTSEVDNQNESISTTATTITHIVGNIDIAQLQSSLEAIIVSVHDATVTMPSDEECLQRVQRLSL